MLIRTNSKTNPSGSSAGGRNVAKPRFKLMVIWKPPAAMLAVIMTVFAFGGIYALRNSHAQVPTNHNGGQIIWQDRPSSAVGRTVAPDSGRDDVLDNWADTPELVYGGGSVSVVADATEQKALQFFGVANQSRPDTAAGNSQRAEQVANLRLNTGKTYWIGYAVSVSDTTGVARNGFQSLWQLAGQPDNQPSRLWLSLNTKRDGLGLETSTDSLPAGQTPYGSWSRLAVGVHITDGADSWVEVWRDGRNVVPRRNLPNGAVPAGSQWAVVRTGLYRSPQAWDSAIKMADLKIGTTKETVQ